MNPARTIAEDPEDADDMNQSPLNHEAAPTLPATEGKSKHARRAKRGNVPPHRAKQRGTHGRAMCWRETCFSLWENVGHSGTFAAPSFALTSSRCARPSQVTEALRKKARKRAART